MRQILINGGKKLAGTIEVSGFKNAALPILVATILVAGESVIENVPDISDVRLTLQILREMGADVEKIEDNTYRIDTTDVRVGTSPSDLVSKLRGSTYLLGAELGRFGTTHVGCPGGCSIGVRPIDQHIKAFRALGADVETKGGYVSAPPCKLVGSPIYFDIVSVGATVNAILASVLAEGMTVIENAAREPHIVDLANFLNSCGASISGAGTGVIKVRGVQALHSSRYAIIPDMIEAGTYMIAAALTGGEVEVTNVIPKHLESIAAKLREAGVTVEEYDESVVVRREGAMRPIQVMTAPYPGFPTDMHPQMAVLLCAACGSSRIRETVFEHRFRYVEELARMGASITVSDDMAIIEGNTKLVGATVKAVDLRAGAAMVLAGLIAEGTTVINEIESIQRGYCRIVEKLRGVGADIELIGAIGEPYID